MNNQHKNNNILTGQSIICAKDIGGLTQVLKILQRKPWLKNDSIHS